MFDINFFKNTQAIKRQIINGSSSDPKKLFELFEQFRNRQPYVFNIETTNICNMKCIFCPRTKLMKRKIGVMDLGLFKDIVSQISPHSQEDSSSFQKFITQQPDIYTGEPSENSFYFDIVSSHLTLHGYGEPLLDPHIVERIKLCTDLKIPTYFSCVPANIKINHLVELMESGLGVIKFSLDSLTDEEQKKIRGNSNNFTIAHQKICELIKIKEKNKLNTKIVITLVDFSNNQQLKEQFTNLWKDLPVYSYIKSQDNRWYYDEDDEMKNKSHYALQYCEAPWISMTIMQDGSVVPCTQDYNCEMTFGDANKEPLQSIWNNEKYTQLRKQHLSGIFTGNFKCAENCDIKTAYKYINPPALNHKLPKQA